MVKSDKLRSRSNGFMNFNGCFESRFFYSLDELSVFTLDVWSRNN